MLGPMPTCFFTSGTATTEIYTLSLHDALPISGREIVLELARKADVLVHNFRPGVVDRLGLDYASLRSEEHTSELQSHSDLVCRLLLEKKNRTAVLPARLRRQRQEVSHSHHAAL